MYKKFDIWSDNIVLNDWKDWIEEDRELNPSAWEDYDNATDKELFAYQKVAEINRDYLDDERSNLNIRLGNPIIIIADLGLWHGRVAAFKFIESCKISDILRSNVRSDSSCHWYCDGYNIVCDEIHHDGTNYYTYREVRDMNTIHNLTNKIRTHEKIPSQTLNRYTRSIAGDVAEVYGLVQRKAG